jgi:predicted glycoside hydrolase/deacetylase ChbG (UPF0249 family)
MMRGRRAPMIITADDFGRDESCTAAIAACLRNASITATSIMANASHFDQACALAREEGLAGRVGVHLVLDEGPALSPEMAPFVDANGNLCVRRGLRRLGPALSRAVEAELTAQIDRVRAAGIEPTHLDSHRHIHTSFPIGRIVVRLAHEYRIPYVRPARNLVSRRSVSARAYKWMFNRYLAAHVQTADHFGDILDFYSRSEEHAVPGLIECMVHLDDSPRGLAQRRLVDSDEFRNFAARYELIGHAQTQH